MKIMLAQNKTLYETDFNQWIEDTIEKLQNRDFEAVDLENLIEEVATLGRSEKREIDSLLMRIFEHILKLTYWDSERTYNEKHWKAEIYNFRKQLKKALRNSPSLKPYLLKSFDETYKDVCGSMALRLGVPLSTFPVEPIATPEQILDDDWFPTNS
jgi:hypothetical protein